MEQQEQATTPSDKGDWWREWVIHHIALFGKQSQPDWYTTLLKWKLLFVGTYSKDEMFAASNFVASSPPPKGFMDEHLAALTDRLKSSKTQRIARTEALQRQQRLDANRCKYCLNTGWVRVPHIRCIDYREWVPISLTSSGKPHYYTMVVTCPCAFGDRIKRSNEKAMTLAEIDALCPDWLRLMNRLHADQVRAAALAREGMPKTRLDGIFDRMMKMLEEGKFVSTMPEREGEDY